MQFVWTLLQAVTESDKDGLRPALQRDPFDGKQRFIGSRLQASTPSNSDFWDVVCAGRLPEPN